MRAGRKSILRCAVYTRKSSDEGLEQDFNSLEARREACEAYIRSQSHEGWRLIPDRFDDGSYSGGTLERPALQQLLAKIRERRVDVIVIYKIDRLTRSLADFARLAELFDQQGVSFVSVTQQFNTTTSMGRLMLNVLLSFAQFECEITGERIRDKVAASKKKDLWMGGNVPIGYDAVDKALLVNEAEANIVRMIYRLYLKLGKVSEVVAELNRLGLKTKERVSPAGKKTGGRLFFPGTVYGILQSPVYIGRVHHLGVHPAVVDRESWDAVQKKLADNRPSRRSSKNPPAPSLLAGLLVDAKGNSFTPSHAHNGRRRHRYCVDRVLVTRTGANKAKIRRVPADEIESVVRAGILDLLGSPARLLDALGPGVAASDGERAMGKAEELQEELLKASPAVWCERAKPILKQIVLEDTAIPIRIGRDALRALLLSETRIADSDAGTTETQDLYEFVVPAKITISGVRKKLILGNGKDRLRTNFDPVLIKLVARAYCWFEKLNGGEVNTIRDIAKIEGVTDSYVTRIMRLAFLPPETVEEILHGQQEHGTTAEQLVSTNDDVVAWQGKSN